MSIFWQLSSINSPRVDETRAGLLKSFAVLVKLPCAYTIDGRVVGIYRKCPKSILNNPFNPLHDYENSNELRATAADQNTACGATLGILIYWRVFGNLFSNVQLECQKSLGPRSTENMSLKVNCYSIRTSSHRRAVQRVRSLDLIILLKMRSYVARGRERNRIIWYNIFFLGYKSIGDTYPRHFLRSLVVYLCRVAVVHKSMWVDEV